MKSISIIIIDSDEGNCLLFSEIVNLCGHIPVITNTVEEAIRKIDPVNPFLIILENRLYKAKEFLQLMERKYNKVKLILTTTSKEDFENNAFHNNNNNIHRLFLIPINNDLWIDTIQNAVYEAA
jgi:DNA-binding NtrC family response regulator